MEEKEKQPVKYVREIEEYWNAYMHQVIKEIYVGISIALGLSEKDAYKIAESRPDTLQKAGKMDDILERLKKIFKYRIPKFRLKKKRIFSKDKPITEKEWQIIYKSLDKYWQNVADEITGDISTKLYLSGKETVKFQKKDKPYQNKSLYQIVEDQYGGKMPSNIAKVYKNFNKNEKKAYNKVFSETAMYVSQAENDIKEAIRQNVHQGLEDGKSPVEIASDMYWNIQKGDLSNKYSAETLQRNWNRISSYETAAIFEAGKLSEYEADAVESLKDAEKAQYFVRTGGTCAWCQSKRGTIVRLVPAEIVADITNESLRSMGIKDPNTDIAIWIGKNNIGIPQKNWMVACPAHPHNVATFNPIDLHDEFYNSKTDSVEKRQEKKKYVPQLKDYSERTKEEMEYRKPTFIGDNLVRYQGNVYEAVETSEYVDKKIKWNKNPSLPIPVDKKSTDYRYIFEEAIKNK